MPDNEDKAKAAPYGFDFREYWAILLKRKWMVLAFAFPIIALVTAYSFSVKPTYTAKGILLIEEEPKILSFEQNSPLEPFNDDYYQTQYMLLQSRTLADATIERVKLYENDSFAGRLKSGDGGTPTSDSILRRKLIDEFLDRLNVSPVEQTRLVEVRFEDQDPELAADILNALFESFIDLNVQANYRATEQTSEFLAAQIRKVQDDISDRERKLQLYGAEKNIVSLSDKETTIVETLGEFNRALTEAQIERVRKETYYNMIKGASPESIPEALSNSLIQRLREEYGKLSREYEKLEERFGPEYPEMQRLKMEKEGTRKSLENELENLLRAAQTDLRAAVQKERSLEEIFNNQKDEAFQLNSNSILYNSLRLEIENKKSLLEALQKRQNETGVSAELKGLGTSHVRIVDRAEAPLYPSSPKKKRNIILALLVGLIGGSGLAFLFERLDDSIKTFDDVERYSGLPSLGAVPAISPDSVREYDRRSDLRSVKIKVEKRSRREEKSQPWLTPAPKDIASAGPHAKGETEAFLFQPGKRSGSQVKPIELVAFLSPSSAYSESYRTIRSSLLLSFTDPNLKCIAVSGPLPQEGKTTTLCNLAITLSQAGKRVLVVDSDLRKPRQHKIFRLLNVRGLSSYLAGAIGPEALIKPTDVPDLFLINAGPIPPNPIELLGSERMTALLADLRRQFDYVLFDTPPILAVTDGLVLGAKLDGIILVVRSERTSREALRLTSEKLQMAKVNALGVIINNLIIRKHDYHYRHEYYHYYGDKSEETRGS